jgi:hypothetical protein
MPIEILDEITESATDIPKSNTFSTNRMLMFSNRASANDVLLTNATAQTPVNPDPVGVWYCLSQIDFFVSPESEDFFWNC